MEKPVWSHPSSSEEDETSATLLLEDERPFRFLFILFVELCLISKAKENESTLGARTWRETVTLIRRRDRTVCKKRPVFARRSTFLVDVTVLNCLTAIHPKPKTTQTPKVKDE